MNLDGAKVTLLGVLEQRTDSEDHSGFLGLDPDAFVRHVHFVEDRDPHWLAKQLRDTRYLLGIRAEIYVPEAAPAVKVDRMRPILMA